MTSLATALAEFRLAQAALVDAAERVRVAAEAEGDLGVGSLPDEIATILRVVAVHYGYSVRMFQARVKTAPVALARQVAMWLCRKHTSHSSVYIGKVFARDHGTVLWAVRSVEDRYATDRKFSEELLLLRAAVNRALNP